jgi:membrane protein YqaA with SNARE-associated domain
MRSKHAGWGVFVASLAESTFVPIPLEVVLLPLLIARREKAWAYAAFALAGCLLGASIGYVVGMLAYETIGQWFVGVMGLEGQMERVKGKIEDRGFWYVLFVAISPVPFQLGYLGAGLAGFSFWLFLLASAIGRGVRYFGLVVLVLVLGKAAGPWLERHQTELAIGVTLSFIGIYAGVSLLT